MPSSARAPTLLTPGREGTCALAALLLHAGLFFPGFSLQHAALTSAPPAAATVDIVVEMPAPGAGTAPGGGSPEPSPSGAERAAPETPEPAVADAPIAAKAPTRQELPALNERVPEAPEPDPDPDPTPEPDLLTASFGSDDPLLPEPLAPKPARVEVLRPSRHPTATAPEVAAERAATSRHRGSGPGVRGGPGGNGRGDGYGNGVVQQKFAFGGPTGAFRADVCFIDPRVRSIKDITRCPRVATFYTDALNVPPRRFREGFPGVSERFEYFAIRYRGHFQVRVGGFYRFRLVSDDGAILYIDGHKVIDNDGQHPPTMKHATIPLEAGEHELFVSYFQGPRENIALQLFVTPPDRPEQLLGPSF